MLPRAPPPPCRVNLGTAPKTSTAFFALLKAHSLEAVPSSRALPAPSLGKPDAVLGRKRPCSGPLTECSTGPGHREIPTLKRPQEHQKLTFLKSSKTTPSPSAAKLQPWLQGQPTSGRLHVGQSPQLPAFCVQGRSTPHRTATEQRLQHAPVAASGPAPQAQAGSRDLQAQHHVIQEVPSTVLRARPHRAAAPKLSLYIYFVLSLNCFLACSSLMIPGTLSCWPHYLLGVEHCALVTQPPALLRHGGDTHTAVQLQKSTHYTELTECSPSPCSFSRSKTKSGWQMSSQCLMYVL